MSEKKKEEPCELCDDTADMIERFFCELLSRDDKARAECKSAMEQKRLKKISYPELLNRLGLDDDSFDRHLDVALKKAERIVKPKNREV